MVTKKKNKPSKRRTTTPLSVVRSLLELDGAPQVERWAEHFATRIHLRVGNRPVAQGAIMAKVELSRLFASVIAMGTAFRFMWQAPDEATVLAELDLTVASQYNPIPLVILLRALEPAPVMRDLRFYLDPTPLGLPPADPPSSGLRQVYQS